MESARYAIKKAVQSIQGLDFREDTSSVNRYIQKRIQNNDLSKIISRAVNSLLQRFQPTTPSVE